MKNKTSSTEDSNELFVEPSVNQFIKQNLWTSYEFAHVLTGWPKLSLIIGEIDTEGILDSNFHQRKPYIIIPTKPFDPKDYGKEFETVYRAIHYDINNGFLKYRYRFPCRGPEYLLDPFEWIYWAIKRKKKLSLPSLPLNLQATLLIKLTTVRPLNLWYDIVSKIIVIQYSSLTEDERKNIISSSLMQTYVPEAKKASDPSMLRKLQDYISRALGKLEQGWQKDAVKTNQNCEMPFEMIPEVLKNCGGYFECNFSLLRDVVITSAFIQSQEIVGWENVRNMNLAEYTSLILKDKILQPYLRESPSFIIYFIEMTIKEVYEMSPDMF